MRRSEHHRGRGRGSRALVGLVLASLVWTIPQSGLPALRPLVPDMLDNLRAIDRIGEAVALEDFEEVEVAARGLIRRASAMQYLDLAALGLDPRRDPEWDAYLTAQRMGAEAVEEAARKQDPRGVIAASQQLVGNSCLACHASFRDPGNLLRSSVGFMTSFLASWRDMNRGLVLRDFNLIGQRARELQALSGVIASDQILEEAFGLGGSKQRRMFREFLRQVTDNSARIDAASKQEDLAVIVDSSRKMWIDGCISCHETFRR